MSTWPPPEEMAAAIQDRAQAAGLTLGRGAARRLAAHAAAVRQESALLHLTSIADWPEFLERHVGESLVGAALVPARPSGVLLDLGSGNGYPGIPMAVALPSLTLLAAESSARKAAFLGRAIEASGLAARGAVLDRRVERAGDLAGLPPISVLATRAMGGWERILPRLAGGLGAGARVLLWAGEDAEAVLRRAAWRVFRVEHRTSLPGRSRSFIWVLVPTEKSAQGHPPTT